MLSNLGLTTNTSLDIEDPLHFMFLQGEVDHDLAGSLLTCDFEHVVGIETARPVALPFVTGILYDLGEDKCD